LFYFHTVPNARPGGGDILDLASDVATHETHLHR
jgi:hypothetical protein